MGVGGVGRAAAAATAATTATVAAAHPAGPNRLTPKGALQRRAGGMWKRDARREMGVGRRLRLASWIAPPFACRAPRARQSVRACSAAMQRRYGRARGRGGASLHRQCAGSLEALGAATSCWGSGRRSDLRTVARSHRLPGPACTRGPRKKPENTSGEPSTIISTLCCQHCHLPP